MTTREQVREIAKQVRESANDLRMLEVLGLWIKADDVAGEGDSGAARYDEFGGASADRIKHVQSQQSAELGTEFDWIIDYFGFYATISEAPYQAMNDALQSVLDGFATDAVSFTDDIRGRFDLGDWDGGFAENFHDNLISPLDSVPVNQAHVVRELQAAVLGHWNLVLAVRKSMLEIGTATKASLDGLIGLHKGGSTEAVLPVVGAVLAIVGVFAAIPSGGTSTSLLPLALAILGAAHSTTSAAVEIHREVVENGVEVKKATVNGSSSAEIIGAMLGEIGKLDQLILAEEEKLAGKLEESITAVDTWLADTGGGDGRKPLAWHLQSFRSELADSVPEEGELDHVDQ